ncbi:hypothetical protein [Streptomyces sp. NPDC056194]|uniref:hypothetical protein n=1 Tax=unclassified Streptomyces TaxID=2593676 RepID=UPI0035D6A097
MSIRVRITAPRPDYNDTIGAVRFVDGVAETDDPAVIGYCQGAGYTVEALDEDQDDEPAPPTDPDTPAPPTTAGRSGSRAKAAKE